LEILAKTKKLENIETTALLIEVNNDYTRTMNKIIFEKFMSENENELNNPELFPVKLVLPERNTEVEAPYYGMQ
jgi:dynein heavy chain